MKNIIDTINAMHTLPSRVLRLCLLLVLGACAASLIYTVTRQPFDLEILRLQWQENLHYIMTAINTAIIASFVFDLELKSRVRE